MIRVENPAVHLPSPGVWDDYTVALARGQHGTTSLLLPDKGIYVRCFSLNCFTFWWVLLAAGWSQPHVRNFGSYAKQTALDTFEESNGHDQSAGHWHNSVRIRLHEDERRVGKLLTFGTFSIRLQVLDVFVPGGATGHLANGCKPGTGMTECTPAITSANLGIH